MSRARQPGGATPTVAITLPVYPRAHARVAPEGELSAAWQPGDYKISAQTVDHADPQGGTWYVCNGTPFPIGETTLIALCGANRPDAAGRSLVMQGTHADVNAIGDSDSAAVADRTPSHAHGTSDHTHSTSNHTHSTSDHTHSTPDHTHGVTSTPSYSPIGPVAGGGADFAIQSGTLSVASSMGPGGGGTSGAGGAGSTGSAGAGSTGAAGAGTTGNGAVPYIVPGNLFIHS